MTERPGRTAMLLEAGLVLASELSLEAVLDRIVDLAVRVTGARYGALGVLGEDGRLRDFITVGITDEQRRKIGKLPVGRGLLGALIHDARPARVSNIFRDPRSVGFPPNHPPMTSFLGAPVSARGKVFGNIYLTEKQGAEAFDEDDEWAVVILAAQAGVAIENARLFEAAERRGERLDATREVSGAILAGAGGDELLELVVRRARELVGADIAMVAVQSSDPELLVIRVVDGPNAPELLGLEFPADRSISGEVVRTGRPRLLADASADPRVHQVVVERGDIGPAMWVALATQERSFGTLMIGNHPGGKGFDQEDLNLVETFATQAAVGLEYANARQELRRLAVMEDRERIARELHDGAIQSLFAVGMGLQGAATISGEEDVRSRLESAVGEIDKVIRDLRNYIFGLRPGILADRQLDQALRAVTGEFEERTGILTVIEIDPNAAAELASQAGDLVQLCREALSNVARHSGAESCRVSLTRTGTTLVLEIDDDGKGFDPSAVAEGNGLGNLRARALSLGGELTIASAPGSGTTVRLILPA